MRWSLLEVHEPDFLECNVCGRILPDEGRSYGECYVPSWDDRDDDPDAEAEQVRRIWNVDPYEDFVVCNECVSAPWWARHRLDADVWLEWQVEKHEGELHEPQER